MTALSNRECNVKCPGDQSQICGGKGSISLFNFKYNGKGNRRLQNFIKTKSKKLVVLKQWISHTLFFSARYHAIGRWKWIINVWCKCLKEFQWKNSSWFCGYFTKWAKMLPFSGQKHDTLDRSLQKLCWCSVCIQERTLDFQMRWETPKWKL